jgi:hypothetical protein
MRSKVELLLRPKTPNFSLLDHDRFRSSSGARTGEKAMKRKPSSQSLWLAVLLVGACACLTGRTRLPAQTASRQAASEKISASAIQIESVESGEAVLPPEFRVAIYENLIDEVGKTGKFRRVYRSGDSAAAGVSDLLILHTRVVGFKQGSQKKREVTTVAGATTIKTSVQLVTRDGRTVVNREVQGRVRLFGENLNATRDLARKVAEIIGPTP